MTTEFKVCSCNRTIPFDQSSGAQLGAALGTQALTISSELCRREIGSFLSSLDGVEDVVVACTQERSLFSEVATQKETIAPLRFVNIRELAGWGANGNRAQPKIAALLAAAALPDPDPVPLVDYQSGGHVLVVGPAPRALLWAKRLASQLDVSVLLTNASDTTHQESMLGERDFPVFSGEGVTISGWLGAFNVRWHQANSIDLELCTRCNACLVACPEDAITLNYQIDPERCTSHRDCVKACGAIGAIDFNRSATERDGAFDLIFDLSDTRLLAMHQLPQGYFAPGTIPERQTENALQLVQMVGEFSKPKFFLYKEKLCAHGRNGKIGCTSCIDVCSAEAISHKGDQIKVNPNLCVGCGACTTVCPSGALAYAYPSATHLGMRLKTMLSTYVRAGGNHPVLLLHNQEQGAELIMQLGRLAQAGRKVKGLPANILPVDLHHSASTGIDVWLSAIAYGATHIAVLLTQQDAPEYIVALRKQMEIAQTIVTGLGYEGVHFSLLEPEDPTQLDVLLAEISSAISSANTHAIPATLASFNIVADKRSTLDLAIFHLNEQAPAKVEEIALPQGAPYGLVNVNKQACTLCMSCVGACPESALTDNANAPQLRFIEKNCVQCGLCEKTCPENAITLSPRLLLRDTARQAVVLNEAEPFHCVRCHKPFGTVQMIENMIGKLSTHGAFAGHPERLKMCPDCRVIDMIENQQETHL